jgi:hypothetical protein
MIKRNERRSDSTLQNQFKMIMDSLVTQRLNGYVSGPDFDRVCREIFGASIRPSIRTRFASEKGKNDGFNQLKILLGYKVLKAWTRSEVINLYISIFKSSGKQPTESNLIGKGVSMTTVRNIFGVHMNAVNEMYIALGLDKIAIYPKNINLNPAERIGEDITRFEIGLDKEPVNEQGVVFVFSKIHKEIGFPRVECVQQYFPDCRAECTRTSKKTRANIEFKHLCSTAFKKKRDIEKYRSQKINYLICWDNDSKANTTKFSIAGIEVISLKKELEKIYGK